MRVPPPLLAAALAAGCAAPPASAPPAAASPLAAAEAFIDAFYSFDQARLRSAMSDAPESLPRILYYQGWAEGGNYVLRERRPCQFETSDEVRCAVTVRDDLIRALGTGYDVTDTFHLSLRDARIVGIRVSSDDPPEFEQALQWLRRERPELMTGPCLGFFEGGPTPGDCVRAVVRGFADFAARPRG